MAITPYRRNGRPTDDPSADFAMDLEASPIVSGQLVRAQFTGGSTLEVAHGLGRPYLGVMVVGREFGIANVVARSADSITSGLDTSKFVRLTSDVATGAYFDLWVF